MQELPFQVAAGSIPGRDHISRGGVLIGKRNQDALAIVKREATVVAVVADGCGSSEFSDVGSTSGSQLLAKEVANRVNALQLQGAWHEDTSESKAQLRKILATAGDKLCRFIAETATLLKDDWSKATRDPFVEAVSRYFLFTLVGTVVTPLSTHVFSFGDGLIGINGTVTELGPFPSNAPPYIAYRVVGSTMFANDSEFLRFRIHSSLPTNDVSSLLIGTDGVVQLREAEEKLLPGKAEKVGPLSQFWTSDRYFTNPDAIRRRLAVINSEDNRVNPTTGMLVRTPGILPDDTTLTVIRRVQKEEDCHAS